MVRIHNSVLGPQLLAVVVVVVTTRALILNTREEVAVQVVVQHLT
jgi:hypothetical protein